MVIGQGAAGIRSWIRAVETVVGNHTARRAFWIGLFGLAATLILMSVSLPGEVSLRAGEIAPYTIKAPADFVNQPVTDALRQQAAAKVAPVYTTQSSITQDVLSAFESSGQVIVQAQALWSSSSAAAVRSAAAATSASGSASSASSASGFSSAAGASSLATVVASLQKQLQLSDPTSAYQAVITADPGTLSSILTQAGDDLQQLMAQGVRSSDLSADASQLRQEIAAIQGPQTVLSFVADLAVSELKANRFQDAVATEAAQQSAMHSVVPVVIARGQVIVREGDPITATDVTLLQEAGLLHPGGLLGVIGGAVALVLGLMAVCWAYFARFFQRVLHSEPHLVLFGSVVAGTLAAGRLGMEISPFLIPTSWASMLAAIGLGPQPGLFVGVVIAILAGMIAHSLAVALSSLIAAWVAVFALGHLDQRGQLLRAGLYAAFGGALTVGVLVLFFGQNPSTISQLQGVSSGLQVWRDMAAAGGAGLLGAVLAIGTLPYIESLGMLTTFRLQELANPGRPLLRRLLVEAPGTYHHSLMVANLAEAACQVVGGDPLLVRAGAYYHDIGKMKRPQFFVENQMSGENPHDKLTPRLSALVIQNHVRDGVEYARQAQLPKEIINIIRSHHGTTLIRYFYEEGRKQEGDEVEEAAFRYEGPRPQTREEAIMMLADGVEAAVRACKQPTPAQIEHVIRGIVAERLEDQQLDRSPLTLRDIDSIAHTFQRILVGAYHARIEYPEQLAAEVGRPRTLPATVAPSLAARRGNRPRDVVEWQKHHGSERER